MGLDYSFFFIDFFLNWENLNVVLCIISSMVDFVIFRIFLVWYIYILVFLNRILLIIIVLLLWIMWWLLGKDL